MKLTDDRITGINLVRGYAPGEVRVNDTVLRTSCLIEPQGGISEWRPRTVEDLTLEDLEPLIALKPEIVVLGSGERQRFPDVAVMAALLQRGIGCEVMDTGAACRTYNILATEARRVVAALLI